MSLEGTPKTPTSTPPKEKREEGNDWNSILASLDAFGDVIPDETLESIRSSARRSSEDAEGVARKISEDLEVSSDVRDVVKKEQKKLATKIKRLSAIGASDSPDVVRRKVDEAVQVQTAFWNFIDTSVPEHSRRSVARMPETKPNVSPEPEKAPVQAQLPADSVAEPDSQQANTEKLLATETFGPSADLVNPQGAETSPVDVQKNAETQASSIKIPVGKGSMDQYLEATRKEKLQKLSEKLDGFKKLDRPASPNELYEHRAESLAERIGLTGQRETLKTAEVQYFQALKLANKQGYSPDNMGDLRKAYNESLFSWNTALSQKAETLDVDSKDRTEALVMRKRDTILRPRNVEIEAKKAGMKDKVWYSLDKWINEDTLPNAGRILNAPVSGIGNGLAWAFNKDARGSDAQSMMRRAEKGRDYARAVRVMAGAGIATFIAIGATPVTASATLLTFMVYGARGALGVALGAKGAKEGGKLYSRFFKPKQEKELGFAENVRKGFATQEEFEQFQGMYGKNNAEARGKQKAMWQMAGAIVAGAGTGALTSPLAHGALDHFGALKSVQDAAETVAPGKPGAAGTEVKAGVSTVPEAIKTPSVAAPEAGSVAHVSPTAPEGVMQGAEIGKGEGFNQLIVDLRSSGLSGDSAVVKHLLSENLSASDLSDELGALDGIKSGEMHVGDKLFVDKAGHLWFERDGVQQLVMEKKGESFVTHPIKGLEMRAYGTPETIVDKSEIVSNESTSTEVNPRAWSDSLAQSEAASGETGAESLEGVSKDLGKSADGIQGVIDGSAVPDTNNGEVGTNGSELERPRTIEDTIRDQSGVPGQGSSVNSGYQAETGGRTIEDSVAEARVVSGESFVNSHGVEVSKSEPGAYEWKVPGTDLKYTFAYGGSPQLTRIWVAKEISLDPRASILVATPVTDPVSGRLTVRMDAWNLGADGEPEVKEGILNPITRRGFGTPNPEDFIRKIR